MKSQMSYTQEVLRPADCVGSSPETPPPHLNSLIFDVQLMNSWKALWVFARMDQLTEGRGGSVHFCRAGR